MALRSRSKLTRLPARLRQIADFVLPGQPVADVGSHHGLVPVSLVLQGRVPSAIAMDLSEDAVTGTRALVERTPGLGGRVQVRQSDGLAALAPSDGVGTLVVSGLGGATIGAILRAAAPGALASLGRGVFQPNVGAPALRATLCALGWVIADEEVALCGGRFYQVIAAQPLAAAAAPPPPPPEADPRRGPQEAPACPPLPSSCRRGGSVRPAAATPKTAAIASALLLARMLSTAGCATTVAEVPTRASMELCMCICPARQPARAARARSEVGRQFEEGESGIPRFQNA